MLPVNSPFSHGPAVPAPQDMLPPSNPHSEMVHKQSDLAAAAVKDMPPVAQDLPQNANYQHEVAVWEEKPQTAHKGMRARIPAAPARAVTGSETGVQLASQLHSDRAQKREGVNTATSAELLALNLQPKQSHKQKLAHPGTLASNAGYASETAVSAMKRAHYPSEHTTRPSIERRKSDAHMSDTEQGRKQAGCIPTSSISISLPRLDALRRERSALQVNLCGTRTIAPLFKGACADTHLAEVTM